MSALNFKKQFVSKIESGEKTQTVRAVRKYPIKVSDTLYLYTGMRTKKCCKIGEAICREVTEIRIEYYGYSLRNDIFLGKIYKGKYPMSLDAIHYLANQDGFETIREFFEFFVKTHKMQPGDSKKFSVISWIL